MTITSFCGRYRFLSNFYRCNIEYEGILYPSVEHAYQAAKTLDRQRRMLICLCDTAGEAKRMGRKVTLRKDWENIKLRVMYELLKIKFNDLTLWILLKATGDAELVEGNDWGDKFWGVCNGEGENWLGNLLMLLRSEL